MLRDDLDLAAFFSAINQCKGEVVFLSTEGDRLNLKSALCQYLFTSVYLHRDIRLEGSVSWEDPEDEPLLKPFLK